MTPVFGHGRLRLYLLKLLDESPRHGYEVIRLLHDRFMGLYAPSAGTVYPRLAKLEQEGLVEHTVEGGRKVYSITDAGRAELAERSAELEQLEAQIHESVYERAREIRDEVRTSAQSLREELGKAAREVRGAARGTAADPKPSRPAPDSPWEPIFSQKMADLAEGLAHNLVDLAGKPSLNNLERELRRRFGPTPEPPARERANDAWSKETDHPPRPEPFDIERVVDRLRQEITPLAHQAGVTTTQIDQARNILVKALHDLRQVFDPPDKTT
ncbi:helix-turn-helix transcriptional regulator [Embleya sp. NBC_00896]|uniref:PadR family transcriptional regulator n=1 Tax=Embleya sp. NBC_00896 TaxID=2975961 RepID=UPI00386D469D|nr:PadR family transcriptional regulator [Embleya sp. NBC_00896]